MPKGFERDRRHGLAVGPKLVRSARGAAIGTVIASALLAGSACGPPGTTSPNGGSAESDGPPAIEAPLDAASVVAYPCTALTDAQVIEAGFPSDIEHRGLYGRDAACSWDYSREDLTGGGVGVVWPLDGRNLTDLYNRRDEMVYFEELTVQGYPAVFAHTDDWRDKGHCILYVGVSDTLAFYVGVDVTPGKHVLLDSCVLAESVAAIVVENLRDR